MATLDRLTGGRIILGAGLGAPVAYEYGSFGDTTDTKVLAERLGEGLHALDLLWSGAVDRVPMFQAASRNGSDSGT